MTDLTDVRDFKADCIALSAIRSSLRKLRHAAERERAAGRLDAAHHADRIADALGDMCADLRDRIEAVEPW